MVLVIQVGEVKIESYGELYPRCTECMVYLPTFGEKRPHSRGNGLINIPYMEHLGMQFVYGWERIPYIHIEGQSLKSF